MCMNPVYCTLTVQYILCEYNVDFVHFNVYKNITLCTVLVSNSWYSSHLKKTKTYNSLLPFSDGYSTSFSRNKAPDI